MAALFFVMPAFADAQEGFPAKIVTVSGAPVLLTNCTATKYSSGLGFATNVENVADVFLTTYSIRFTIYDHGGTVIGQDDLPVTFTSDLAPGDTALHTYPSPNLSAPLSSAASATCRLQTAKFEGGKSWTYGRTWSGKLSQPPATQSLNDTPSSGLYAAQTPPRTPSLKIAVVNAWNDVAEGVTFVHDSISVEGGDNDVTLTPSQFTLTMPLANGARKTYYGLMQPAPTYQKLNPLGSTTMTAYEVDPRNDLGGLHSIIVPAHGTVAVTVTFLVPDVIANANDNRQVSLK